MPPRIPVHHRETRTVPLAPVTAPLVLASLLLFGACGGSDADPTEPREVRPVETEPAVAPQPVPQDPATPSRGLPCSEQNGALRLCGAATDNYKASFNEDPDAPEARTWLAVHELELDGVRYVIAPGQELVEETLRLRSDAGDEVELAATIRSGQATALVLRNGPQQGLWGPLLTIGETPLPADAVIVVDLRIVGSDANPVTVAYRHDPTLADPPTESLERGGPGGRWHIAGVPTATNLELGWE